MNSIKIAIVEDHNILLNTLGDLLDAKPKFKVVIRASNGQEFFEKLNTGEKPDIVILDLNMPIMDGRQVTITLRREKYDIKILILSMFDSPDHTRKYKELGVSGFLSKGCEINEVIKALYSLSAGGSYFPLLNKKDYLDNWGY